MNFAEDNFVTIQGWMRTGLGLKGNDLLVYAAIYGFSQKEDQWFTGGQQYLAELCGSSIRGIRNNLEKLEAAGLIEVTFSEHDARLNKYRTTSVRAIEENSSSKEIGEMSSSNKEMSSGIEEEIEELRDKNRGTHFQNRGTEFRQNINKYKYININTPENKEINNSLTHAREEAGHFIPPTVEDVRVYCLAKGFIFDPEEFVDFYAGKGWMVGQNKIVDWKSVANNFERKKRRDFEKEQGARRSKKTIMQEMEDW